MCRDLSVALFVNEDRFVIESLQSASLLATVRIIAASETNSSIGMNDVCVFFLLSNLLVIFNESSIIIILVIIHHCFHSFHSFHSILFINVCMIGVSAPSLLTDLIRQLSRNQSILYQGSVTCFLDSSYVPVTAILYETGSNRPPISKKHHISQFFCCC